MKKDSRNYSDACHWGPYSTPFCTVTTIYQSELYRCIAGFAEGRVLDAGCGSAKFSAYIAPMLCVSEYVGVECSQDMVNAARSTIEKLDAEDFSIVASTIEDFSTDILFDIAVSTNSFYAWSDPDKGLDAIYQSLKFGGSFFLVTPNPTLDMAALIQESFKELLMHPSFGEFSSMNFQFANGMKDNFVSMDILVKKVLAAGFKLVSCNTDYFNGGVNFIHAYK